MQEQTQTSRLAWSIESFADACGICREGVYRAIREKRLRAKKFGNRTLILETDGRAFIAELPDLVLGEVAEGAA